MKGFFAALGRTSYRRRRPIAALWGLVLVAGIVAGGQVFDRLSTDFEEPSSESAIAARRLEELGVTARADIYTLIDGIDVRDQAFRDAVTRTVAEVGRVRGVESVIDFYSTQAPQLVSRDGRATVVAVDLADGHETQTSDRVEQLLRGLDAPTVLVGGEVPLEREFVQRTEQDLRKAEMVTLPVILLLLLVIFGGLVAAGLPLIVALVSIPGAFLVLFGISLVTEVAFYAVSVVTMLGLGLAIDYALLMVNRFREERAAGCAIPEAVERTVSTAGRTVFFSGLTVTLALSALLAYPGTGLRTLAYAGSGVVVVAMVAAITLLPALLAMWGRRIRPARLRRSDRGTFYRLSRLVQRRAVPIVLTVGALLVALWIPFAGGARLENSDVRSLPTGSESRRVYETVASRFVNGGAEPIVVLADASTAEEGLDAFADTVRALPGVLDIRVRPDAPSTIGVIDVIPEGETQGELATTLVSEIRETTTPFTKQVTGPAASLVDFKDLLVSRLPYALAVMAAASFVLLFLMTGSVVVPLKAIVMNVVSLGASMGAMVWGFQEGHLAGLLGFTKTGALDTYMPLIIFVFAYGLSMDYEVFLLSRIKETYDETGDNDRAVALGLQRTGRIVTSAALLIVVVFLGFAAGQTLLMKQFGVGMAVAILIDATVVRALLVPASMKLMGSWNWWAPHPLRRFHERFGLSELPGVPGPVQVESDAA
ncbi:MAG TPA: MMPL family transporter [Actinomycetota bacterium]